MLLGALGALKAQGIIDYGHADTNMSDYEEDHLVPSDSAARRAIPQPVTRALLRFPDRALQGRSGDEAEERRVRRHHDPVRSAIKNNWTTALQVTAIG